MDMRKPKDQFMSTVKVGEKGQVVIPKEIRDMFNIKPGETLLMMADTERGIAIVGTDAFRDFIDTVLASKPSEPPAAE